MLMALLPATSNCSSLPLSASLLLPSYLPTKIQGRREQMPSIHLSISRDQQPIWPSKLEKESNWGEDVKHWRKEGLDLPNLVDYAVLRG